MVKIYVHAALFVADGLRPFDESITEDVAAFIRTVMRYKGLRCLDVCVMPDHVHLLLEIPQEADVYTGLSTLQYWLQDHVERNSSQASFAWQERVWMVSKSPTDLQSTKKYFRKQDAYHELYGIDREWEDLMDLEEILEDCRIVGL
jgi:REP element-mobilizing transposase RayT